MLANKLKCVIWDLDDTIWDGSLAEQDMVMPRQSIVELIPQLDKVGVINSICSKNDFTAAKNKLVQLGIWDYFVFPVIDFIPKGQSVKQIIQSMLLRPENVLFVDDNVGNLNEVKYYCHGIMLFDANNENFFPVILETIKKTEGTSRLSQYKILEKKSQIAKTYSDNNSFLAESDITVCIIRNPADLVFKDRIAELANRSNQLNLTNSRFHDEMQVERYFNGDDSIYKNHGAIFVYDKIGSYGLVGFYAFDERSKNPEIEHFFFSCRILNMGIEYFVYKYLRDNWHLNILKKLENCASVDFTYIKKYI